MNSLFQQQGGELLLLLLPPLPLARKMLRPWRSELAVSAAALLLFLLFAAVPHALRLAAVAKELLQIAVSATACWCCRVTHGILWIVETRRSLAHPSYTAAPRSQMTQHASKAGTLPMVTQPCQIQ